MQYFIIHFPCLSFRNQWLANLASCLQKLYFTIKPAITSIKYSSVTFLMLYKQTHCAQGLLLVKFFWTNHFFTKANKQLWVTWVLQKQIQKIRVFIRWEIKYSGIRKTNPDGVFEKIWKTFCLFVCFLTCAIFMYLSVSGDEKLLKTDSHLKHIT